MKTTKSAIPRLILIGIYALLFFFLYSSTLHYLVTKDWERESFSYCYLIPFVVFYLIWISRAEISRIASNPSWAGVFLVLIGIFFFWIGELGGEFMTIYLSMWLVIVGLTWTHLGWQKIKVISFPLFFILTMFPPPVAIMSNLTLKLQLLASKLGAWMVNALGIPVFLEGNVISLPYTQLQVVEACSGLHSLISLMVLSLIMAYFYKRPFYKRAIIFFASIPLAIALNAIRIAVTAVLHKYVGPAIAEGFFHGFSGVVIFFVGIPTLFAIMLAMDKILPTGHKSTSPEIDKASTFGKGKNIDVQNSESVYTKSIPVLLVLAISLVFSNTIDFDRKTPQLKDFSYFPLNIGSWSAQGREKMENIYLESLDLSDYVIIDYYNSKHQIVSLYIAYYESQSKGESIHSPSTCLPGGGWDFKSAGTTHLPINTGNAGDMVVKRALMQKGSSTQLSYYWFPQRGRILTNPYQLKLFNILDSITKHRTDGALVRIITPVYDGESLSETENRIQDFTASLVPILNDFLPGN